jgi:hypothetical protein
MSGAKSTGAKPTGDRPLTAAPRRSVRSRISRRLTVCALLAAAVGSGAYAVWRAVREQVVMSPHYELLTEAVSVTPPPDWVRGDVRAEVMRDAGLDGPLSVLDEDLSRRLYEAFEAHPWVARVERVLKRPPAAVEVELVYRRPVLMVRVPAGLLPLDVEAVQLPTGDFSALAASHYPRLTDIEVTTGPPSGSRWSDPRVQAAARLAGLLIDCWEELELHQIAPMRELAPASPFQTPFELQTKLGTRIAWGEAPSTEADDLKAAREKLARLKQYHAERGTLEGPRGPQDIDLRLPGEVRAAPRTARHGGQ